MASDSLSRESLDWVKGLHAFSFAKLELIMRLIDDGIWKRHPSKFDAPETKTKLEPRSNKEGREGKGSITEKRFHQPLILWGCGLKKVEFT